MAYTKTDRLKAVRWYRDNGKNCIKTASKFGVGTATINRWLKSHPEILNAPQNESVIVKIEHGRAGNIIRFEEKQARLAERACELAYNKLMELIPVEKDINKLVAIIEKLNPLKQQGLNSDNKNIENTRLDEILESYNKKWREAKQVMDITDAEELE
ncbi:MAG: IS630 transposase-related protein [Prevotella sp.]|jgi:transposase-like protein|nr:IS630 transposase-related protein [Prevotella sp.]